MSTYDDRFQGPAWPQQPTQQRVPPPEPWEPAPGWRFAGIAWRMTALAIDVLLCTVVVYLLLVLVLPADATALRTAVLSLPLVYLLVCWAAFGTTLGKVPFGMHVVRGQDGGPIGWFRAVTRLGAMVVALVVASVLGGLPLILFIVLDRRRRGVHDHVANTVVIRRAW